MLLLELNHCRYCGFVNDLWRPLASAPGLPPLKLVKVGCARNSPHSSNEAASAATRHKHGSSSRQSLFRQLGLYSISSSPHYSNAYDSLRGDIAIDFRLICFCRGQTQSIDIMSKNNTSWLGKEGLPSRKSMFLAYMLSIWRVVHNHAASRTQCSDESYCGLAQSMIRRSGCGGNAKPTEAAPAAPAGHHRALRPVHINDSGGSCAVPNRSVCITIPTY
eukprot:2403900-Pleurochrysis_carterae.AAC.3